MTHAITNIDDIDWLRPAKKKPCELPLQRVIAEILFRQANRINDFCLADLADKPITSESNYDIKATEIIGYYRARIFFAKTAGHKLSSYRERLDKCIRTGMVNVEDDDERKMIWSLCSFYTQDSYEDTIMHLHLHDVNVQPQQHYANITVDVIGTLDLRNKTKIYFTDNVHLFVYDIDRNNILLPLLRREVATKKLNLKFFRTNRNNNMIHARPFNISSITFG